MQLHETTNNWRGQGTEVVSSIALAANDWLVAAVLLPLPLMRNYDWLKMQLIALGQN